MRFTLSGGLFAHVRGNCISYIGMLPDDKPVTVEVKPLKSSRSLAQNAALFGCAYPPIMQHMGLRGERDREDLHQFWMMEYFGTVEVDIMGKRKVRPRRTTTTNEEGKRDVIDKATFADFYSFIQQRSAEYGIIVPDPDPMHNLGER